MDLLIEWLLYFVFDVAIDAASSKKTPKWLRFLLIPLLSLFILAVLGGVAAVGVWLLVRRSLSTDVPCGVVLIALDAVMIVSAAFKIKKQLKIIKENKGASNDR